MTGGFLEEQPVNLYLAKWYTSQFCLKEIWVINDENGGIIGGMVKIILDLVRRFPIVRRPCLKKN